MFYCKDHLYIQITFNKAPLLSKIAFCILQVHSLILSIAPVYKSTTFQILH